ncbi:MAG: hypothetical protein A2469_03255 [Candidatus Magasanikbacteria bacterium RIFOXYC2_FULL_40_16]|uniref:Uncharacterized protein n=2 Tax=Candidatus Magasanikiibacteriota TaxID=1752731 RepID=A0A1F6NFH4_9BACT|nr:MAG: hypothetical protein A2224_00030 [Candidatus Magasanikbacteria bacterium RIFOXYA2_FULL_40_20]OGH82591.1 MAG: hypothetical protein A2373_03790 [Candidatus Magasanikbacteria bacterium RIFOXYB1_FULL_40_15]OGH86937.1 MAG: hypothetical protein A2301_02560 [Candidatus Magasanikbacteria bacterium RIFOXYB2_FULL_40_13]OGH89996.1 MAG: hypothetical protein A2469_03255 [Candidatus Magasanikbacteria bacterium RIFOXYC2_FULL_40_16]
MFKPKEKSSEYIDTTGELTSRSLKLGTWYVEHKELMQKIGLGILIGWCVIFMGYSLLMWGEYLFFGYWEDQKQQAMYAQYNQNYESIKMLYKAQDLKISNVRIFGTADKFYDFAANVQNQNEKWMAKVSYHFKYGNTETEMQTASVMPLSERPLVAFGLENDTFPTGVNFVLDKIDWEAVDPHRISNAEAFLAERNLFSIDNFYVDLPSATGLPVPALYMDLLNQSAYSYWEPVFLVELINGNQTVGYIHLYFDKIEAFSTEKVDLRYFNKTTEFNNVRIIPTMNYFDESIYIGPGEI